MLYTSIKKVINSENTKYTSGITTAEEYNLWKESMQKKLDVFLLCNRITQTQYEEFTGMFINTSEATANA